MASESADQALPPDIQSFVICGKTWKVGDEIHSTGIGAIEKKKMVETFGAAFATARAEGVFLGRGSGQKYRVKWTNLLHELILEYGPNHSLFKDPSKERPPKVPKINGPQRLSMDPARSSLAGPNMSGILEVHPSSGEESESDGEDPQIPGISPLQIGENVWRTDPVLDLQDPRFGLLIANHQPKFRFTEYIEHGIEPTELQCFNLFIHDELFSHILERTNSTIERPADHVTLVELKKWIGVMYGMTLSPISNIEDFWMEEDDGLIPAHQFGIKTGLSKGRFKFIRQHFASGPVGAGIKTFDAFRPIQTFFNARVADSFSPGEHVVVDESTSGWHGKDEKRPDGPPAMTHMKGKPEPVSFMFKTLCCVQTGIMIAFELQEGKDVMATRRYSVDGEKSSTGVTLRLMDYLPGPGFILSGDSWFASLNTLRKVKKQGHGFMGNVKMGHSGLPVPYLRGVFNAQSERGATVTLHLGDGNDRIFVHAWNEPGWKGGKPPKKAAKVFISNVFSAAPVVPWQKERTCLLPDGTVERRILEVPQTQVIREYFRTANRVDIHNQYRQGLLAIERIWKTKSWNIRLFQTVMGMILVNAFFAFRFKTGKSPTLSEFTNVVAQALCGEAEGEVEERPKRRKSAKYAQGAVGPPSDRITHALVKGKSLGVGGIRKQGSCRVCKERHASGVCVTCSTGLDSEDPEPYWLCSPGVHGRQCYCQHLHQMLLARD